MGIIKTYYGQPCYNIFNDTISVLISIQGGHVTASYKINDKYFDPFFYPPWWDEAINKNLDSMLNILRGSFFCFPFGINAEPYEGDTYPAHGQTSNGNWDLVSYLEEENRKEISLKMDLKKEYGEVIKSIKITEKEPVIYENNTLIGYNGKIPIGYNPTIKLPGLIGSSYLDISKPITGFTTPTPAEDPQKGGYSMLRHNKEVPDMKKIPTIYGTNIDIFKCPFCKGFEDIYSSLMIKKKILYIPLYLSRKMVTFIFSLKIRKFFRRLCSGCQMVAAIIHPGMVVYLPLLD